MSDVELEVPEDMEIRMVVELQSLGKFLLITIPTKLKDLSVPLSMAFVACMFASHAPCNMFYGCRSCLATCLEEDAIPAVGEEPKEPLIAGDFSGQSVGEEEVRLSNYNGCSALRGSVSGHTEQRLISKDCQLLDPQPAVEVRALQGSKAVDGRVGHHPGCLQHRNEGAGVPNSQRPKAGAAEAHEALVGTSEARIKSCMSPCLMWRHVSHEFALGWRCVLLLSGPYQRRLSLPCCRTFSHCWPGVGVRRQTIRQGVEANSHKGSVNDGKTMR